MKLEAAFRAHFGVPRVAIQADVFALVGLDLDAFLAALLVWAVAFALVASIVVEEDFLPAFDCVMQTQS